MNFRFYFVSLLALVTSASAMALTTYLPVNTTQTGWAATWQGCSEIRDRDACLENPNCNWIDATGECKDVEFHSLDGVNFSAFEPSQN